MGRPLFALGYRGYDAVSLSREVASMAEAGRRGGALGAQMVWPRHDDLWFVIVDVA